MNLVLVLIALGSIAQGSMAQDLTPFDFDWNDVKDIWDALDMEEALGKIIPDEYKTLKQKIVGGSDAKPSQFPFYVLLKIFLGTQVAACGGSLLNYNWVLTVRLKNEIQVTFQISFVLNFRQLIVLKAQLKLRFIQL